MTRRNNIDVIHYARPETINPPTDLGPTATDVTVRDHVLIVDIFYFFFEAPQATRRRATANDRHSWDRCEGGCGPSATR